MPQSFRSDTVVLYICDFQVDADGNGSVDLEEFTTWLRSAFLNRAVLLR